MSYTMYTPLNVWLDPASVTDVVAYIQNYLSENTIYSEEEIEELIHDYLIAHPELIGGVQSVNGKTGTVILSASDINTANNVTIESVLSSLSSQISSISSSVATNTSNITNLTGRMTTAETDISNLKSSVDLIDDVLELGSGNVFDATTFTTTNTTNWTLEKTKTSITITHNNTYSTGAPRATLNLPAGTYKFNADFSGSSVNVLQLNKNGSYYAGLYDDTTFELDGTSLYELIFYTTVQGVFTITDISIVSETETDNIIDRIQEATTEHVINVLTGLATQNTLITNNGVIASAGSNNYRTTKYTIESGKEYIISGNANYGNAIWCFYDSSDSVVEVGELAAVGSTFTTKTDVSVTSPNNAAYLIIAWNVTQFEPVCKTSGELILKRKWLGKKWVCVGDSLTEANTRTTKHYFDYISEKTGITTVNMGVSGTGYARGSGDNNAFYQRISSCPTDADVVTIFGSFNDLGAGLEIGTVDDTGTTTLAGCINTTITNLQTVIPLVNLGIVAPTPWDTTQPSDSGQAYNYVNMLKKICERRSIPFLDLWRCSNLRPWDSDFRTLAYSKDEGSGTHPDENGHLLIAPRFEGFLDTLLLV